MRYASVAGCSAAFIASAGVWAASPGLPRKVELAGHLLPLAECVTRDLLFIEVFTAGLYLPPHASGAAVADKHRPKELRIRIASGWLIPQNMPEKWQQSFAWDVTPDAMQSLQRAWRRLGSGDVVVVSYAPASGTSLSTNGTLIVEGQSANAFLRIAQVVDKGDGEQLRFDGTCPT